MSDLSNPYDNFPNIDYGLYSDVTDPNYEDQYADRPEQDQDQDILNKAVEGSKEDDGQTVIQSKSTDRTIRLLQDLEKEIKKRSEPIDHKRITTIPLITPEQRELINIKRNEKGRIIDPNHLSVPVLTKYERSAILSERALMINQTASTYLSDPDVLLRPAVEIAEQEFNSGVLDNVLIVIRQLPNRRTEYWKLGDLSKLTYM